MVGVQNLVLAARHQNLIKRRANSSLTPGFVAGLRLKAITSGFYNISRVGLTQRICYSRRRWQTAR